MEIKDWSKVSFEEGRRTLRQWREDHVRRSEEVVELWEHTLSRSPASLGDELWTVYEQVCVAALDSARLDLAFECIRAIDKQFPNSHRALRLHAMRYEALEQYKNAEDLYDKLIEYDPTNNQFRKRKVAIQLAKGDRLEAIRQLNDYLKTFINDTEAWLQLGELFLLEGDYMKAAHCMEEVILAQPHNSVFLRRLADIRYTAGGQDNVELARIYYEQASKLNPNCIRSLYGLVLACNQLASKATGARKREMATAASTAAQKLIKRYEEEEKDATGEHIPQIVNTVKAIQRQLNA